MTVSCIKFPRYSCRTVSSSLSKQPPSLSIRPFVSFRLLAPPPLSVFFFTFINPVPWLVLGWKGRKDGGWYSERVLIRYTVTLNPGKCVTTRTVVEVQVSVYWLHVYFSGPFRVAGSWPRFSLSALQCHLTQDSKNNRISVFRVQSLPSIPIT